SSSRPSPAAVVSISRARLWTPSRVARSGALAQAEAEHATSTSHPMPGRSRRFIATRSVTRGRRPPQAALRGAGSGAGELGDEGVDVTARRLPRERAGRVSDDDEVALIVDDHGVHGVVVVGPELAEPHHGPRSIEAEAVCVGAASTVLPG